MSKQAGSLILGMSPKSEPSATPIREPPPSFAIQGGGGFMLKQATYDQDQRVAQSFSSDHNEPADLCAEMKEES